MITILLQKILEQIKTLKDNIELIPTVDKDYSFDEKIVGKWVDGSTLYQKTCAAGSGITSGYVTFEHGVSNIDKIIYAEGVAFRMENNYITIPRITGESYPRDTLGISAISSSSIVCYVGSNLNGLIENIYVTLRYTKSEVEED